MMYLFLFFAILRTAVWLPSMIALINPKLITEAGMFWGILLAAIPGETLYIWGQLYSGGPNITFAGTLIAIAGSPLLAIAISKFRGATAVA
jgi:hypothetical protein